MSWSDARFWKFFVVRWLLRGSSRTFVFCIGYGVMTLGKKSGMLETKLLELMNLDGIATLVL